MLLQTPSQPLCSLELPVPAERRTSSPDGHPQSLINPRLAQIYPPPSGQAHPAKTPPRPGSALPATPNPQKTVIPTHGAADWGDWCPDTITEPRIVPEQAVQLEHRGITQQPEAQVLHPAGAKRQLEIWHQEDIFRHTIAAKLREVGRFDLAAKLEFCRSQWTMATCDRCGSAKIFPNRCDLFYCPSCQPRLARDRVQQIAWWAVEIRQPKHIVLTVKNIPDLTAGHIDQFRSWFTKLRRRKFARNWRGGFYSLELTKEEKGWHLHLHALIDAQWIDQGQLATEWASCNGGCGYIVHVRDARPRDYIHQVCKYVVKGNQLAGWSGTDIATLIEALSGRRTFGVFGTLYGKRTEWSEWLSSLKESHPRCECGSNQITYKRQEINFLADLVLDPAHPARPPNPTTPDFSATFGYTMPKD